MNINQLIEQLAEKFAEEHLDAMQGIYEQILPWDNGQKPTEAQVVIERGEQELKSCLNNLIVSELERKAEEKYAELCKEAYGKVQYHKHGSQK